MKKYILTFLICCLSVTLQAQQYKSLFVTGIEHSILLNSNFNVNRTSFPCYFTDSLFLSDIADTLLKYAAYRFSIDTLRFSGSNFFTCNERYYPVKLKPVVPVNANSDDLFLSLSTSISFRNIEYQEVFYQLETYMYIANGKNRKVYKSKVRIPFVVKRSDGILSDTLMHKNDFEIFYLDALTTAFYTKSTTIDKRFIYQPLTERYDNFLYDASDYKVERGYSDFALGKDDGERLKILDIQLNNLTAEQLDSLFTTYKGVNSYEIIRAPDNEKENVTLLSKSVNTEEPGQHFQIKIIREGMSDSSSFLYEQPGIMKGVWDGDSIEIQWNAENSVSELRINHDLVALIHYADDEERLYYRLDLYPGGLEKIAYVVFLYDEAENTMKKSQDNPSDFYYFDNDLFNLLFYNLEE